MILRHLRAVVALAVLASAAVTAGAEPSLAATVKVPKNAPSGEQYGVIWAQQVSKGTGNRERTGFSGYRPSGRARRPPGHPPR